MTLQAGLGEVVASGYVTIGGGAITNQYTNGYASTVTRTGAGDYAIAINAAGSGTGTPGGGIDAIEYDVFCTPASATACICTLVFTSSTSISLKFWDAAGVAVEPSVGFSFEIKKNRRINN